MKIRLKSGTFSKQPVMKFNFILYPIVLLFTSLAATAQFCIPEQAEAFSSKAMSQINPKHIRWIDSAAADIRSGKSPIDEIDKKAKAYGVSNNFQDMDIEAMVMLVIMEISKDAEDDVRAIMEQMREANKQKQAMRDVIRLMKKKRAEQKNNMRQEYLSRTQYDSLKKLLVPTVVANTKTGTVTLAELDSLLNDFRDKLDSMNEMGEMVSLRLQMIMDRRSKMISTLSNIMKKISKTQDEIVKNLK